jgi:hypothetical protein
MANPVKWSGVAVAVQSALGTAVTLANITNASPGVANSDYGSPSPSGHGYSSGDYVVLDVLGMDQVDGRVFRVATPTTYTFQLESEHHKLQHVLKWLGPEDYLRHHGKHPGHGFGEWR